MNERDTVYLEILRWGLLGIRAAGALGMARHCEIEADHLHNVPALIGSGRETDHDYYIDAERPSYLEQIDPAIRDNDTLGFVLERYEDCWEDLIRLRGR